MCSFILEMLLQVAALYMFTFVVSLSFAGGIWLSSDNRLVDGGIASVSRYVTTERFVFWSMDTNYSVLIFDLVGP